MNKAAITSFETLNSGIKQHHGKLDCFDYAGTGVTIRDRHPQTSFLQESAHLRNDIQSSDHNECF